MIFNLSVRIVLENCSGGEKKEKNKDVGSSIPKYIYREFFSLYEYLFKIT